MLAILISFVVNEYTWVSEYIFFFLGDSYVLEYHSIPANPYFIQIYLI